MNRGRPRKENKRSVEFQQLPLAVTRAGIYLRVSTEEQADSGLGIDSQRTRCIAMAQVKAWQVVKEYNDAGISGTKDASKRPDLEALLNDARAGAIDAVIILSLDRLGRNAALVLSLVNQLAGFGTQLVSCKEALDTTTATGKFVLNLFASLAQLERDQTAERTKAALTELGKSKGYKGGRVPYGYCYKGDGFSVEIDPSTAEIVKRIFREREAGRTYHAIANDLNRDGIPTPRGGDTWRPSTLYSVLENVDKYSGCERYTSGQLWPALLTG